MRLERELPGRMEKPSTMPETMDDNVRTQLSVAGREIRETGEALGEFVGSHGGRLWYDPAAEAELIKNNIIQSATGVRDAFASAYADPVGAAKGIGSAIVSLGPAAINWLDDITNDPEAGGKTAWTSRRRRS